MNPSRVSFPVYLCFILFLTACGGGGGSDGGAPTTPPAPVNNAPTITGTSAATVDEDADYSFIPEASDADGDTLTFSVENLPEWAGFDTDTGELNGTPSREDAGIYSDIVISVSDGDITQSLPSFDLQVLAVREISLNGKATDAPLSQGEITVTVGDNTFNTTADNQGNYNLTIVLRDGEYSPADMLTIKAVGAGEQAHIELISQITSYETLIEIAGSDEQLIASEIPRLNITQLSTARYLLAADKNNGVAATPEQLSALEQAIDADRLHTMAGLIKLLADNPAYALPDSASTLTAWQSETTSAWETAMQWLQEQGLADESGDYAQAFALDLNTAINATLTDTDVVQAITDEDLVGIHILSQAPQQGHVPSSEIILELHADGTGMAFVEGVKGYDYEVGEFELTWTKEGNRLILNYPSRAEEELVWVPLSEKEDIYKDYQILADQYGFSHELVEQINQAANEHTINVYLDKKTIQESYTLIPGESGIIWAQGSHQVTYTLDSLTSYLSCECVKELPTAQITLKSSHQLYTQVGMGQPDMTADFSSGKWALPLSYTVPSAYEVADGSLEMTNYIVDLMTVNGEQTTARLSGKSIVGNVEENKLSVTTANERYEYIPFASNGVLYAALVNHYVDEELEQRLVRWIAKTNQPDDLELELTNILTSELPYGWNSVWEFGHWASSDYQNNGLIKQERAFALILSKNNDYTSINPEASSDAVVPSFWRKDYSGWEITSEGLVSMLHVITDRSYVTRDWILLGGDENQYLILEQRRGFNDRNGNGQVDKDEEGLIQTPLLKWLQKVDLSQWQEAWENSTLD
ncbi:putative Ig domain-containing protein [Lacimicrobium alkaliphilum]|uniref:Dystroglycan-type cadherin-like domain-containing protein n=1 Tax=Lacimicrobium alkaliphilum TaxID=1526571 RepID=A0ABQ1QXE6_9ALTE|nr:putative Ig domain-containing protein [Lacimicrobium alkaliphilum]GGD48640.1 hypothetical protein GCM10011357_00670 [Lacimicrobium alkaliphilum]